MSTIPEAESHPPSERTRGGFFAVDRSAWPKACDLGLNAAVAYLVLACGTGKDHQHTAWSASAVSSRTSIGRRRASEAIDRLRQHRLVRRRRQGGSKPRYRLVLPKKTAALIWLPNTIVDGIEGAASSLERVRQTGDVMLLRLLVALYGEHHLQDDCGVSRGVVRRGFTRHAVGSFAEYDVYGFAPEPERMWWGSEVTDPHKRALTKAEERQENAGYLRAVDFF
jgi:DNA-binding transcriptional ArsR family regulator